MPRSPLCERRSANRPRCQVAVADASSAQEAMPMPDKETIRRARQDAAQGKSASTQAGEFVREEIHHVREGKHGARSPKQAIAIGLSKARRAGVKLPAPKGKTSTRKKAGQDSEAGKHPRRKTSTRRSRATE